MTRRALEYSRRTFERIAFLVVIHGETPQSLRLSTDGDPARAQNIYKNTWDDRPLIIETQRDGEFALVHMPGRTVLKFGLVQWQAATLSDAVKWTDEQRARWKALRPQLSRLRECLAEERRRLLRLPRQRSPQPFGMYS